MDKVKELISQYEQGLLTEREFWSKMLEASYTEYNKIADDK